MNFWEIITGSDMTRDMKAFEMRVSKLPSEFQDSWEIIKANTWPQSDFTGRKLIPILDGVLGLMEEAAANGLSIGEVLDDDIKGFCSALVGDDGAGTFRDKWRRQLNNDIARKLGK